MPVFLLFFYRLLIYCWSYLQDVYALKQVKLGSLSGLVPKEKAMAFERILFRATRGNILLKQESVDELVTDPQSGEKVAITFFYNTHLDFLLLAMSISLSFTT